MKRIALILALLLVLSCLMGCGSAKNKTPEDLIDHFLTAVQEQDYEAIWGMIPKEIQNYAIDKGFIQNKADGLRYIAFAVNDYYWLESLNLPSRRNVSFRILECHEENAAEVQAYLMEDGVRLTVDDCVFIKLEVTADGVTESPG